MRYHLGALTLGYVSTWVRHHLDAVALGCVSTWVRQHLGDAPLIFMRVRQHLGDAPHPVVASAAREVPRARRSEGQAEGRGKHPASAACERTFGRPGELYKSTPLENSTMIFLPA